MDVIWSIPIVLIAIIAHEVLGHSLFAKKVLGVNPTMIFIGMPIKIGWFNTVFYVWKRKGKTPIAFSWLLLGGGVGFADDAYYGAGRYWRKVLMLLSGPAVNLFLSILVIAVFTSPMLGLQVVASYSLAFFEVIKSFFTSMTVEEAMVSHQLLEITLELSRTTGYWMPLSLFALWNVSIGIVNLLPVPGLDGGQEVAITLINIFGERVVRPIKIINVFFYYVMVTASLMSVIWWISTLLL